jgi:hypothetical protein
LPEYDRFGCRDQVAQVDALAVMFRDVSGDDLHVAVSTADFSAPVPQ